jgi:hypothetical protein
MNQSINKYHKKDFMLDMMKYYRYFNFAFLFYLNYLNFKLNLLFNSLLYRQSNKQSHLSKN